MRSKISAGILLYRKSNGELEVFLVHPGGPFWKNKDEGAWSIPKGEADSGSSSGSHSSSHSSSDSSSSSEETDLLEVAKREFFEETSFQIEDCCKGEFFELAPVKLKSGKTVYAFAIEGDIDAEKIVSNAINIEWPPRSGKQIEIPEVDRGGWFGLQEAMIKINPRQVPLLVELQNLI